jgi:hypothetical protein
MKKSLSILALMFLSACALPNTSVRTSSIRPTLAIVGAPENAMLYVDGVPMGVANQFNGQSKVLTIEEGAHRIEVRLDGRAVHSERILVSTGELKTVHVNAGAK